MAKARDINGRATVSFTWHGKRRVEYVGQPATLAGMRIARDTAREVGVLISRGVFDATHYLRLFPNSKRALAAAPIKRETPTLGEYCREWLEEQTQLKPQTKANYRSMLEVHVCRDPIGDLRLDGIHDGDLKRLQERILSKTTRQNSFVSKAHHNAILTRLRTIFSQALRRGLIQSNPTDPTLVRKVKPDRSRIDPLNRDDMAAVIDQSTDWSRNLFTILVNTGCRPSETLALRWEQVDREGWSSFEILEGKTELSARVVYLNAASEEALRDQEAMTGKLEFVFGGREPISQDRVRRAWYQALDRARVAKRVCYQLRHSFAVLALEGGASIRDIADALGHTDVLQVTRTYLRWLPGSRKAAAVTAVQTRLGSAKIDRELSHFRNELAVTEMIADDNG